MKLKYEKEAVKYINKLDRPTKQRIKEAIEKLPLGDVKNYKALKMIIG